MQFPPDVSLPFYDSETMNKNILEKLLSGIPLRVPLDKTEVTRIILQFISFIDLQYSQEETGVTTIEALEKRTGRFWIYCWAVWFILRFLPMF